MYYANNEKGEKYHISEAIIDEEYFCPICNERLVVKRGEIKAHHFAHYGDSMCSNIDGWHYDMSDWHRDWQMQFPKDNQEVVFSSNGKKHRADVFINNTIIEFQHSNLSPNEFEERNNFYESLGYKVIWIVDAIDDFDGGDGNLQPHEDSEKIFVWKRAKGMFRGIQKFGDNVEVFLQLYPNTWEKYPNYREATKETEIGVGGDLLKVDWISPQGIKYFAANEKEILDVDFLEKYINLGKLMDILNCVYDVDDGRDKGFNEEFDSIPILVGKLGNYKVARLENVRTHYKVQITPYDIYTLNMTRKLMGKISFPNSRFNDYTKEKREIYYWNNREWKVIWYVT